MDSSGKKCIQPGFWYHKSINERKKPSPVIGIPKAPDPKPATPERIPTAEIDREPEKSAQVVEKSDYVSEDDTPPKPDVRGQSIPKSAAPIPMSQNPRFPKSALNGVDPNKISSKSEDRYRTNGPAGERMIEKAKEIKRMIQAGGHDGNLQLVDDTDKPWVTFAVSSDAKKKDVLKDFDPGGPLAGWKDGIRLRIVKPEDKWVFETVGLPVKGDPAVIVQSPDKKVELADEYTPDALNSTLRRINPKFDPNKVPKINIFDGIIDGLVWRSFYNRYFAGVSSVGSTLLVLFMGAVVLAFLAFLPDKNNKILS